MRITVRNVIFGSAAAALFSCAAVTFAPTSASAGPLLATPSSKIGPEPLVETVQFSRRARGFHVGGGRFVGVHHGYPRYARYGYRGHGFFPGAAFGLIAGTALGAATFGSYGYACDPYYDWSWASCPTYPNVGYDPGYWGVGDYPGYLGAGYYPVYRSHRIVYRHAHRRPVVYPRGYMAHRSYAPRVRHMTHHARPIARMRR